jgi:hypothetical protein
MTPTPAQRGSASTGELHQWAANLERLLGFLGAGYRAIGDPPSGGTPDERAQLFAGLWHRLGLRAGSATPSAGAVPAMQAVLQRFPETFLPQLSDALPAGLTASDGSDTGGPLFAAKGLPLEVLSTTGAEGAPVIVLPFAAIPESHPLRGVLQEERCWKDSRGRRLAVFGPAIKTIGFDFRTACAPASIYSAIDVAAETYRMWQPQWIQAEENRKREESQQRQFAAASAGSRRMADLEARLKKLEGVKP